MARVPAVGDTDAMVMVGWLPDATERSVREALADAAPDLVADDVVVSPKASQPNPRYWSGSAAVDGRYVVKFAWDEVPAIHVWREGVLLERLAAADPELPIPHVVRVSRQPALVIMDTLPGGPMSWEWASARSAGEARRLGAALGTFLARLHGLPAHRLLADLPPFTPTPQADTARLRLRYPRLVDDRRGALVLRWCEWVDAVLRPPSAIPEVLVHGDFHGYNQLWDHAAYRLVAVVDFEESGIAEAEFDFRYLPGNSHTPQLTLAAMDAYEEASHRRLDRHRVLAWNVVSHLGDALWRTEADVELPGGGDARTWVDDLATRLGQFGVELG